MSGNGVVHLPLARTTLVRDERGGRVRVLAGLSAELRARERILSTSAAGFGERYGMLAAVGRGRDPSEPGLVVVTDERLLFFGERGARLVVERAQIASWWLSPAAGQRTHLWAVTPVGSLALYEVSVRLLERVEEAEAGPVRQEEAAPRPPRVPAWPLPRGAAAIALACLAALVWTVSLARVDPSAVGDAGLVSALPVGAFLALALACAGFAATLTNPAPAGRVLALQVVALVFMLYAVPYQIGGEAPFNVAWRHAGITDYIAQHGAVDPGLNAYFNWPGFFVLAALAEKLAAVDLLELVPWVPFVTNLLYLAPLLLIARAASDDPRLPWAAAWIFYLANWVYQDYLSPQGLTYVLYLALAGLLLGWVRGQRRPALVLACVLLALAAVPSHQLTPFAMLAAVVALALLGRNPLRTLPALLGVLIVTWVVFAAGPYLSGHLETLKEDIGDLGATISSSVTERVDGSATHVLVTQLRLATAVVLWALAALAAVRLWRRRERRFLPVAALAAAPFTLVALQAYGGEILLRVYLLGLPFVSVLVATLLFSARSSRHQAIAVGLASLALAGGFLVTRFGNERVNMFTPREIRAVDRLYDLAPPGSVIVAPNSQLPWQSRGVGTYRFKSLDAELEERGGRPLDAVAELVDHFDAPAGFVIITSNNREYEELFGRPEWGTIAELERSLERSPRVRRILDTADAELFAVTTPSARERGVDR